MKLLRRLMGVPDPATDLRTVEMLREMVCHIDELTARLEARTRECGGKRPPPDEAP